MMEDQENRRHEPEVEAVRSATWLAVASGAPEISIEQESVTKRDEAPSPPPPTRATGLTNASPRVSEWVEGIADSVYRQPMDPAVASRPVPSPPFSRAPSCSALPSRALTPRSRCRR